MKDEMELNAVVASVLLAVQEAKRLSDLESARLAEVYKTEKSLSVFTVPAFAIADMEVELRFAVTGPTDERPEPGRLPGLKVSITAASLKGLDPSHIQVMKIKVTPVPLRVFEEQRER